MSEIQAKYWTTIAYDSRKAGAPTMEDKILRTINTIVIRSFNEAKFNNFIKTILTCSSPEQVKNTTHAVPRFRGAHVSQSGAPKGDPHRFQCYNNDLP